MGFVCTKPLYVRKHSSVSGQFEFKASGFNKVGATTLLIPRENVSKKLRSNFYIREASIEDLDAVTRIESHGGSWSKQLCEGQLTNQLSASYVSLVHREDRIRQDSKDIVGWVAALYIPKVELQILQLTVLPEEQGQGIGSYLLHSIIDVYCDQGVENVVLEVRESNAIAIHIYEKAGFVITGTRPFYYPDGENALLMARINDK